MKNDLRRHHRYAHMRRGTHNKFYQIEVSEREDGTAEVIYTWGRIGTRGQTKRATGSFDVVRRFADEQFEKKLKKGYEEANIMEALAAACQPPEERHNTGLPSVEIDIPKFHAGKSEDRCRTFAQKYIDKLNLVRRSRWDLLNGYDKQIEGVLASYCKEWKRICNSKTHSSNVIHSAAQSAYANLFYALRENAGIHTFMRCKIP